ncbi:MAG: radical SAM protein [Ruminococcaceae bacterium]|nr:radical SAM protein [Oscillospiraceae bacterium]
MKKFKKIYIEITNICNLSCSFCPGHRRPKSYMSATEFETAVEKTHRQGENFYLHLMGEPLGHPQFGEILDICDKYDIQTNITTNGTLLKKRCEDILNHNVRSVCISMHSFGANSMNVSLQQYLEDIVAFCNSAMGKKTTIELRLWNMSSESLADKEGLNYRIIEFLNTHLQPENSIFSKLEETFFTMEKNRKKNFRIKENIFLGMAEQFSWPDIEKSPGSICEGFCYGLRNQIAVLSDGTVVPCCLDCNGDMALGNIFENELEEIYNSPRSRRIYDGFTNMKAVERLCQSCGYMKKYLALRKK